MLIDTNKLMQQTKDVFLGIIPRSETEGKPIHSYNVTSDYSETDIKKVDLTLKRVFTLHNFFDGFIIVYYTVFLYGYDNDIVAGSAEVFSLWRIHKEKGKWSIIAIKEAP
jgi:hypothetical protein